jgi:hypothetical protein
MIQGEIQDKSSRPAPLWYSKIWTDASPLPYDKRQGLHHNLLGTPACISPTVMMFNTEVKKEEEKKKRGEK